MMSIIATKTDLLNLQKSTLDSLITLKESLEQERKGSLEPLKSQLTAAINNIQTEINAQKIIKTRLEAAAVLVKPVSEDDAKELATLADKIDAAIIEDAKVNAMLATVNDLIKTAMDIGKIVDKHSNSSPA